MKYFFFLLFLFFVAKLQAQENNDTILLEERLKRNIFLKVEASSTDCFVGEPIIVSYKLYSAMASESSIVKSPSFKGFDVKDLKSEADEIPSRETIDGVEFDVHTVLKLQLTPYKNGRLLLGALTMRNRVKLVEADGKKDPVLNNVNEDYVLDNGYFNLLVSSVPVSVMATPLPANITTSSKFEGLVGDFKMKVRLSEKVVTSGKATSLLITITGKGDFSKVKQPEIQWPDKVEVLPATINEGKTQNADGSRHKLFEIPFIINEPGTYMIPSIEFSFFDAANRTHKTITKIPIQFNVVQKEPINTSEVATKEKDENQNIIILSILVFAVLIIMLWMIFRNRKRNNRIE